MEEGVAMKSLTVGGTVTRAVIFAVRDSGMRPGLLYAVSVYTVLVNGRTTTKPFGSTSETSPVAPSVGVARTAVPGLSWTMPGIGSMRTLPVAPRTEYENCTGARESGFGSSTVKLSITGRGWQEHVAPASAMTRAL